eukprot:Rhum_TRINITY_DN24840_c0_g1::Rhum_TRINITY_DN24840_c0_g1_i1::g.180167::m.180167/K00940/ndk, NME; nucleoside-diphosphate kinase
MSLSAPQARRPPLAFAPAGARGPPCMDGAEMQRTFVAVKPEGATKALLGDIIRRFEKHGHKMIGMKLVHPSLSQAQCHYRRLANKPYFRDLCEHFISGPVVLMVWEGCDVVDSVQELMHVYEDNRGREPHGGVNPPHRHLNTPSNLLHNIAHTSESVEAGIRETNLWFGCRELMKCSRRPSSSSDLSDDDDSDDDDWQFST